jgi:hypothetical protein
MNPSRTLTITSVIFLTVLGSDVVSASSGVTAICTNDPVAAEEFKKTDPLLRQFYDSVCPTGSKRGDSPEKVGVMKYPFVPPLNQETQAKAVKSDPVSSGVPEVKANDASSGPPSGTVTNKESIEVSIPPSVSTETKVSSGDTNSATHQTRSNFEVSKPLNSEGTKKQERLVNVKTEVVRNAFINEKVSDSVKRTSSITPAPTPQRDSVRTQITRSSFLSQ